MWKIIWLVVAGYVVMSLHSTVENSKRVSAAAAEEQRMAIACAVDPGLDGCNRYETAAGKP